MERYIVFSTKEKTSGFMYYKTAIFNSSKNKSIYQIFFSLY